MKNWIQSQKHKFPIKNDKKCKFTEQTLRITSNSRDVILITMHHIYSLEHYKHSINRERSSDMTPTLKKCKNTLLSDGERVFHPVAANGPLVITVIIQNVSLSKNKIFKHCPTDKISGLSMYARVRGHQSTSCHESQFANSGIIEQSNFRHNEPAN